MIDLGLSLGLRPKFLALPFSPRPWPFWHWPCGIVNITDYIYFQQYCLTGGQYCLTGGHPADKETRCGSPEAFPLGIQPNAD